MPRRKRKLIGVFLFMDGLSLLCFPLAYGLLSDPPTPEYPLPPAVMRTLLYLLACSSLAWAVLRDYPRAKTAQSLAPLFLATVSGMSKTFFCSLFGLLAFLTDSP